ncbi:LysR family transcriptional regulator [Phaeobacter inhibens]|uniref:LysR family transcriptional regulator n=1 Tax=Phaeobacter inhibens TaxID=221822 RepID=UPI00276C52E2|nr:LysR family transcriptional regulator [Phaeobacter inhibens]GLO70757.1 LysR family transcriptional regulator [Phaeobacter inhibens]
MRLTYKQVAYIREIAKRGSITDACKALHISQSSLLAAVEAAEQTTKTRLFHKRRGHGVILTPAGKTFLNSAQKFLAAGAEFGKTLDEFSVRAPQILRLGCFSPFGALLLPPLIKRYSEKYGSSEILLREGDQVQLRSWLASGDVDLIVTYDIGDEFTGELTPICKFPAHALLNIDDEHACCQSISMAELADKPLILLDLPETRAYLLALFDLTARRPTIALRTRSYQTIRSAVASGLGASLLNIGPSETSPDTESIVRIPISDPLKQPTLLVANPYGELKPDYVRDFIDVVFDYFTELGPDEFAVVLPEFANDLLYERPKN